MKDLVAHFRIGGSTVSQRSGPLLRMIGVQNQQYGRKDLGSPRYLTGGRRSQLITDRDHYRANHGAQR